MAYIYKITNSLNGKIYIGKTLQTPEERFKEHIRDSKKERCEKRPLYDAINKYGAENFLLETIEECSDNIVNEREIYWIEYYQSFKYGYNATKGGDGKHYLDYDLICSVYAQLQNCVEVAKQLGISTDSVYAVLKNRSVQIKTAQLVNKDNYGKIVHQFSLDDKYLRSFSSLSDAAQYLIDNKLTNCKKSTIRTHISEVCRGKRKIAAKFKCAFKN